MDEAWIKEAMRLADRYASGLFLTDNQNDARRDALESHLRSMMKGEPAHPTSQPSVDSSVKDEQPLSMSMFATSADYQKALQASKEGGNANQA